MNKKVIAEIQTQIDASKLKLASLEKMLDDTAIPESTNNALALQQQKHDLMIDSPDDTAAIEELSNRLAIAIEADRLAANAANDAAALRSSIKNRIATERVGIENLTIDYKSAVAGMLQADADKKAADRDAAMVIFNQKVLEIEALEIVIKSTIGIQPSGLDSMIFSANHGHIVTAWRNGGGTHEDGTLEKSINAEIELVKASLTKAGISA